MLNQTGSSRNLHVSLRSIVATSFVLIASAIGAWAQSFVNWENMPLHAVDLSPDGVTLAAVNLPDNRIEFFDMSSGLPSPTGAVQVGLDPVSVRWRPDGTQVWVANHVSDTISVIDAETRRVVATIQTADEPYDLVFAGTPERAFVSCSQANSVQVINTTTLTVTNTIAINGEDPRALAVNAAGTEVYVAIFESGNATTLVGGSDRRYLIPNIVGGDAHNGSEGAASGTPSYTGGPYGGNNPPPNVGGVTTSTPTAASFTPAINADYLPSGADPAPPVGLIVRKNSAGQWMDDNGANWSQWITGADAGLTLRQVGWDMPDRDVAVINVASETVSGYAASLMNMVMAIGVNPATGNVTTVGTDATNEIRFEPNVKGTFIRTNLGIVDPLNLPNPTVVDLNAGHLTYSTATVVQSVRDRSLGDPRGIVWNAAGTRGYVTGMGSNNLAIIDQNGLRAGAEQVDLPNGPVGVVLDETRNQLYVMSYHGGINLSVVNTVSETVVHTASVFDPSPDAIKNGRIHLYGTHETSGLGHIACASCHVDSRIDRLSWDLGDPGGAMQAVVGTDVGSNPTPGPNDHNLNAGGSQASFKDWHPMKGPLTTQSLQAIIGLEPFHHRGDKDGLEAFNGAFISLQGDDGVLSAPAMQEFEDHLATIFFPPNPYRNFDNTLPTNLPLPDHFSTGRHSLAEGAPLPNGNAQDGFTAYTQTGSGATRCVQCHTVPTGMSSHMRWNGSQFVEIPPGQNGEALLAIKTEDTNIHRGNKVGSWRNLYERTGTDFTQLESRHGFGIMSDGREDNITRRAMANIFNFGSDQGVADFVALVMSFTGSDMVNPNSESQSNPPGPPSNDTHAAVGRQVTITNASAVPLFDQADAIDAMLALADAPSSRVDVVVKGKLDAVERGWYYDSGLGLFRSDIDGETESPASLRAMAATASELTYTVVANGTGERIGIDRDEDGVGDRSESLAGSSAVSALSLPLGVEVLFEDNIDAAPLCGSGAQCFLTDPSEFPIPQIDLSGEGWYGARLETPETVGAIGGDIFRFGTSQPLPMALNDLVVGDHGGLMIHLDTTGYQAGTVTLTFDWVTAGGPVAPERARVGYAPGSTFVDSPTNSITIDDVPFTACGVQPCNLLDFPASGATDGDFWDNRWTELPIQNGGLYAGGAPATPPLSESFTLPEGESSLWVMFQIDGGNGDFTAVDNVRVTGEIVCTADIDCDDSNVCTDDMCNLGTGLCEVTNNTDACDDSLTCTSGDVCSAGICAGADNCTSGASCDPDANMCVDPSPPPHATSSHSNTQQSSGTDGTDTDTFVAASDLVLDTDYLVIYNAGFGGSSAGDEVGARIEYGATVLGRAEDEGSSSGDPEAVRIHQLAGFAVVAGTGTDELRIKHQVSTGTSFIKGKGIVTVPFDQLVLDTDYFVSQHNDDAAEASTSSGAFTDVRNATFDLPDAGDYLVLASMEATMASGATNGGSAMRLQIGGTTQKMEWGKEWETNNQSQNFAYARIHNLSAGNNTFSLQGGTSQGSRTASFRRSRIIVIRAASYDQLTSTTTDVQTTTPATFETSGAQLGWDNWLENAYTPNQTEDVVVIGNGFAWQGQNYRSTAARLENTTDATVFSEFTADDAKDISVDRITHLVTGFENIATTKTYAFQLSNEDNTNTASQRRYGDLIVWSMLPPAVSGVKVLTPNADSAVLEHDPTSNIGANEQLQMRSRPNAGSERQSVSFVRFSLASVADPAALTDAKLEFESINQSCTGGCSLQLYGLDDGTAGEDWVENSITYDNAPTIPGDGNAATQDLDTTNLTLLDTFQVDGGPATPPVISTNWTPEMLAFLQADTNGLVTFVLYENENANRNVYFATKEHSSAMAPTLTVTDVGLVSTCGDSIVEGTEQCDDGGTADGDCCSSTCEFELNGSTCGDTGTECTNQDTCDGSGTCTDNGFVAATTGCGDTSDTICTDPDSCDGAGNCQDNHAAASVPCRADSGSGCDVAETCDGAGACPVDSFAALGTACGDGSASTCDLPNSCDASGSCLDNFAADGLVCSDDDEATIEDQCDNGVCSGTPITEVPMALPLIRAALALMLVASGAILLGHRRARRPAQP